MSLIKREILTDILNQRLAKNNKQVKAHPCHRIDYETSGVIIYAKGKKAQQAVMDQFHKQKVKKKYIAYSHSKLQYKLQINSTKKLTLYSAKRS